MSTTFEEINDELTIIEHQLRQTSVSDLSKALTEVASETSESEINLLEKILQSAKEREFPFENFTDAEQESTCKVLRYVLNRCMAEKLEADNLGTVIEHVEGLRKSSAELVSDLRKMSAKIETSKNH